MFNFASPPRTIPTGQGSGTLLVCALLTISVFTLLMNFGFVLWTEMGRKEATDQLEITLTMEVVK